MRDFHHCADARQLIWVIIALPQSQNAEADLARVVKLVDAGDSKSPAARRAGSIPAPGTIPKSLIYKDFYRKSLKHSHQNSVTQW